jgi:S-adenosylmethionine:tRNA ribosyltransferase-isomerase
VRVSDFTYDLPADLIAQNPAPARDQSRLLVFDRGAGKRIHTRFAALPEYLRTGDLLVLNDARVLRARLRGRKVRGGGRVEALLAMPRGINDWWAMLRPGKRVRPGTELEFCGPGGGPGARAIVEEKSPDGLYRLRFAGPSDIVEQLDALGEMPLPPYIERAPGGEAHDAERYQTVYARSPGAVAAPTAGLHFTAALLQALAAHGVELCHVTLHVGPGTFAPVTSATLAGHVMHAERFELTAGAADQINAARAGGRRVVAVGTTSVRVLEHVAAVQPGPLRAASGTTRLFLHPPCGFRVVDALLTNFHLPGSTLLMLVCAFADPGGTAGCRRMLDLYAEAVSARYRFFSYGDAMLIV